MPPQMSGLVSHDGRQISYHGEAHPLPYPPGRQLYIPFSSHPSSLPYHPHMAYASHPQQSTSRPQQHMPHPQHPTPPVLYPQHIPHPQHPTPQQSHPPHLLYHPYMPYPTHHLTPYPQHQLHPAHAPTMQPVLAHPLPTPPTTVPRYAPMHPTSATTPFPMDPGAHARHRPTASLLPSGGSTGHPAPQPDPFLDLSSPYLTQMHRFF